MTPGIVFDIKELAIHDGPGIRTTVFLKGCPLDCTWCHNPEGKGAEPQVMRSAMDCRLIGREYSSQELAALLNRQAEVLRMNKGGVTFSGGEPLHQSEFLEEVIGTLDGIHVTLDTSGYAEEAVFRRLAARCDLILFDLKIMDDTLHRRYTGRSNRPILNNLDLMNQLGTPLVIRVPLVPGVTDTKANLGEIAATAARLNNLQGVELLRYNRVAGGKHSGLSMKFVPDFDEFCEVTVDPTPFQECGMEVTVR